MKTKWLLEIYSLACFDSEDCLDLAFSDGTGGVISKDKIDEIKNHPNASKIIISGLKQNTFDYFIDKYGKQFKVIYFWKCPHVGDLSKLGNLEEVQYVLWFWNQRAVKLWDMTNNKQLIGLCLDDFTRVHDLAEITTAPALEEFSVGDKVWNKYILNSLEPFGRCKKIKLLWFTAKKLINNDITPLANMNSLEELNFSDKLFTTEQIAWLTAKMPNVKSDVLAPYRQINPIEWKTEKGIKMKDTFVIGKGKPFLDSKSDKKRLDQYIYEFNTLVEKFKKSDFIPISNLNKHF